MQQQPQPQPHNQPPSHSKQLTANEVMAITGVAPILQPNIFDTAFNIAFSHTGVINEALPSSFKTPNNLSRSNEHQIIKGGMKRERPNE